jgi:hypothetical protein
MAIFSGEEREPPRTDCDDEHALLAQRRARIARGDAGDDAGGDAGGERAAPPPQAQLQPQAPIPFLRALAFSGGGIRSATFSLGVLQAVAEAPADLPLLGDPPGDRKTENTRAGYDFRNKLLSRFDYLSTVSGGYVGAFFAALFKPDRLRPHGGNPWRAADDACSVLGAGPPGRMRAHDKFEGQRRLLAPLAWLRDNARYLLPTGAGDASYALAMSLRNWAALHYVIGVLLVMVFSAMLLLRAWAMPATLPVETRLLGAAVASAAQHAASAPAAAAASAALAEALWWSPYLLAAAGVFALLCVPVGIAFWMAYQDDERESTPYNLAVMFALALAAALYWAWRLDDPLGPRHWVWLGVAGLIAAGVAWYLAVASGYKLLARLTHGSLAQDAREQAERQFSLVSKQRVALTRDLANMLRLGGALALLGVLDTLGQTLYLVSTRHLWGALVTPAGVVGALVWLAKAAAAQSTGGQAKQGLLARLPLALLAGLAGLLIMALAAVLWCFAVNWAVWQGRAPSVGLLGEPGMRLLLLWLLAGAGAAAAAVGQFPSFINLSSLQPFYSARITRAFLGASNGARFDGSGAQRSTAEPMDGDNLRLSDFVVAGEQANLPVALSTLAPLHIINVTINKTVDPAEQLVQRDRKGQPLAVLPYKFCVDGSFYPYSNGHGMFSSGEIKRPMSLGQWVGTSGAAFSTGIGRATTFGTSMLMGAANVRLGVWWESGVGQFVRPRVLSFKAVSRGLGVLFRTQAYLSYEFRARFYGMHRKWQYLSDGGHFENTALYELLRPQRRVRHVLATDCGADPGYSFDDLANLIRLVRIDFGVEVKVRDKFDAGTYPALATLFGATSDFAAKPEPTGQRCALLLSASKDGQYQSWVVLFKPMVPADAPADVAQYHKQHPSFPQEPTTDQFFDEAQWESYRSLGHFLGRKLLTADVMRELASYIGAAQAAPPD